MGGPPDTYWDDPVARGDVCDECGGQLGEHADDCPNNTCECGQPAAFCKCDPED